MISKVEFFKKLEDGYFSLETNDKHINGILDYFLIFSIAYTYINENVHKDSLFNNNDMDISRNISLLFTFFKPCSPEPILLREE